MFRLDWRKVKWLIGEVLFVVSAVVLGGVVVWYAVAAAVLGE